MAAGGGGGGGGGNAFLATTAEDAALNQYWYSAPTLAAMLRELDALPDGCRVAFLSTPSVFFSWLAAPGASEETRAARGAARHALLDLDTQWATTPGFHKWDFTKPTEGFDAAGLTGAFDAVVMDPPFITTEVWEAYAVAARALCSRPAATAPGAGEAAAAAVSTETEGAADATAAAAVFPGKVLASTIVENEALMARLFGATPTRFQPSIPHLVYQYNFYTNFPPTALAARNPEIPE